MLKMEAIIQDTESPEKDLAVAVLRQAFVDLQRYPKSDVANSAIVFFANKHGWLDFWCTVLDLDVKRVQASALQQYPTIRRLR